MGTRGFIARQTGIVAEMSNRSLLTFAGRYHHWDSYPLGLGSALFRAHRDHFRGDTSAMMKYLIDDHPAGWSQIYGQDFSKSSGYGGRGPQCYCHGERSESETVITESNAANAGCEYGYIFNTAGSMIVASSYNPNGRKMIGAFGMGNPNALWRAIAEVDLSGGEPDWEAM